MKHSNKDTKVCAGCTKLVNIRGIFCTLLSTAFDELKWREKKSTQNSKILQLKGLNVNNAATLNHKT
jgi:hypothetical protein